MYAFLIIVLVSEVRSEKCYGISFEGGGSRGSYESGVLYELSTSPKAGPVQYNSVSGVSVGSITAGFLAQAALGEEVYTSEFMINFWLSLNGSSSVFVEWPGGLIDGLLFRSGLYNNEPGILLQRSLINQPMIRNVTVGASNLDTGLFQVFNKSLGNQFISAVICSGSLPFVFPPCLFNNYSYCDGGVIINLDVFTAIQSCLEYVEENETVIDIVFDVPQVKLANETKFKTIEVMQRVSDIQKYDKKVWTVYNSAIAYPQVQFRYLITPSSGIQPALNFTKSAIEFDIQLGISDTKAILDSQVNAREKIFQMHNDLVHSIVYP